MPPRKSTHRGSDESKRRILEATLELVNELGYEGTTIPLVSQRSGLPSGSVYWHFSSKDELMEAMIQDAYERWRERYIQPGPDGEDTAADLNAVMAASFDDSDPSRGFLLVGLVLALEKRMEGSAARKKFLEIRRDMIESSTAQWRRKIRDTRGHDDPVLARKIARLHLAAMDGLLIASRAGELDDPVESTVFLSNTVDMLAPLRN